MTPCGYRIIRSNGTETMGQCKLPDEEPWKVARRIATDIIGEDIEHVTVFHNGRYTSMYVDELGHMKGLPRNETATAIYRNNVLVHEPGQHVAEDLHWIAGAAVLFARSVR